MNDFIIQKERNLENADYMVLRVLVDFISRMVDF